MDYDDLPITDEGKLVAYKGVRQDMFSSHGNINTKVIEGVVDSTGRIRNQVGDAITVERNQVDDDRSVGCSFGLHVGSLDYAKTFASKIVIVEVDPKDVVSVPKDCVCQKMRVCSYNVIGEYEYKIEEALLGVGTDSDEKYEKMTDAIKEAIDDMIERAINYDVVQESTIKQIRKIIHKSGNEYCKEVRNVDILMYLVDLASEEFEHDGELISLMVTPAKKAGKHIVSVKWVDNAFDYNDDIW
jgi:hypothetical protein